MPVTVFAGPDPDACLAALLGRIPLRGGAVCAVVPDAPSVSALERRLAGTLGGAFTGHRVFTLGGLAREALSLSGPVPETIGAHIRRALADELAGSRIGPDSRLRGLAAFPGFAGVLTSWLEDIRSGDESAGQDTELAAVAAAYDHHLRHLGLGDHEGLILLALADGLPERFAGTLRGPFILHGFSDLTGFQARFLERIMAAARRSAVTLPYDSARPDLFVLPGRILDQFRSRGARIVAVPPRFAPGTEPVLSGFHGGEYSGDDTGAVEIHTFRSPESEADWVAGTIRANLASETWTPGEIMVVSRNRPGAGSPLALALGRNGIPLDGGVPLPLDHHPVVRFILRAIEASVSPERDDPVREVRRSAFAGAAGNRPTPSVDDRAWDSMIEGGSPENFVASVRDMLDALRIREHLDGGGDPSRAAAELLAYTRFCALLDDFPKVYGHFRPRMRGIEFERLVRQFIRDVSIPAGQAPGTGVLVTGVNQARHISRPVVFVTGADNGAFPMRAGGFSLHDPSRIPARRERAGQEEPLLFHSAMRGARRIFFTFPGIDDEGSDSTLSPYVREIREKTGGRVKTYFHHGVPGAAWEGGCTTPRGRAESLLRELRRDESRAPSLLAEADAGDPALSGLLRRAAAAYAALSTRHGELLTAPSSLAAIRRDWGTDRVFSVTALERYTACPLRFFFERLLRLTVERELPGELDPAGRGTLIHEILAAFYRGRIARGTPGFTRESLPSARREIREICRRVFARRPEPFQTMHAVAAAAEKEFISAWMEAFLEREAEYFESEPFRPAFVETDFGSSRDGKPPYPPLASGGGEGAFLLGGRIDRIDIARTGEVPVIRVIDYKTGEHAANLKNLGNGRDLQLPLYLRAAAETVLPGSAMYDAVFSNLKTLEVSAYKRDKKPLIGDDWDEYTAIAAGHARAAAAGIRAGRFPAGGCLRNESCDFRGICRSWREKSGEAANADS